jgi:hypothetical protein
MDKETISKTIEEYKNKIRECYAQIDYYKNGNKCNDVENDYKKISLLYEKIADLEQSVEDLEDELQ